MLQSIRSKAQGIITWIIVGLIVVAFSFVGINYFFSGAGKNSVAAKVNGQKIYWRTIDNLYHNYYRQYSMRPDFDPSSINSKVLKLQIRHSLVNQQVLLNFAQKEGYRVGNEHLTQIMNNLPYFQKDGKFSKEIYLSVLKQSGMNPKAYQENLKNEVLLGQLLQGIGISSFSTDMEKEQVIKLINQQRDFGYVILSHEKYLKDINVTDDQISDYYKKYKEKYMTPEEVELQYIELSLEDLQQEIDVNEEKLKEYYDKNISLFVIPEKVKVSHILINAPMGSDKDVSGEARLKANDILAKIKVDGEKFENLVSVYSEDKFSVNQQGELSWIGKGEVSKHFEEMAFKTKVGEVGDEVVQTEFGYHIIKVIDKKEEGIKTFSQVKDEIADIYKKEQADMILSEKSEELANYAFEYSDSLEEVSKLLNLKIKNTKRFSKQGLKTGVESVKNVIKAAFNDEVLNNKKNSDLVKINDERYVVVRLKNHYPPEQKPYDEVKAQIKDNLIKQHAKKRAIAEGNELLYNIKKGNNPNEAAMKQNLVWNVVNKAPRGYDKLHYVIMQSVFSLPRHSQNNEAKVKGIILPNGDYAVVALSRVIDGKIEKTEKYSVAQIDKSIKKQVEIAFGRYEYNLYEDSALNKAKIVLNDID